jgi:hypothetical protein
MTLLQGCANSLESGVQKGLLLADDNFRVVTEVSRWCWSRAGENVTERWRGRFSRACGGATVLALLLVSSGCKRTHALYGRIVNGNPPSAALQIPGRLAQEGDLDITTACAHQTFANARKGLIAHVTGMHEDVFELRDRMTLATIAFGLQEAQRLESLLRAEARAPGRGAEQAGCVQQFAEYFETLTDPMVESNEIQKQLDVSAFNDSSKHAQEELEKEQMLEETKPGSESSDKTP